MSNHLYPPDHDPAPADLVADALAKCIVAMNDASKYIRGFDEKQTAYYQNVLNEAIGVLYQNPTVTTPERENLK